MAQMWQLAIALGVLLVVVVGVLVVAWRRTWQWNDMAGLGGRLRGLALPNGSVRAVLAIIIIGGFVIFAFFGTAALDDDQFDQILSAWIALTGAVSGFYFGARTGQTLSPASASVVPGEPTFSVGDDESPAAPAPEGSVYLSKSTKTAYLRKGGTWKVMNDSLEVVPNSVVLETGIDLNNLPEDLATSPGAGAYVVAEDAAAANYRLACSDASSTWRWVGDAVSKPLVIAS